MAFGQAFRQADVDGLRSLLAENYIHVNGRTGSVLEQDQWLDWIASRNEEVTRGELVINSYGIEDLAVRLQGDAAVVTGIARSTGVRKGVAFSSDVRFTNVWVFRDGRWLRAAFHDSPVAKSGS